MLLSRGDLLPVEVINPQSLSPFLLLGDHAGNRVPEALGTLGLCPDDLSRHIGWDIGVASLGGALAAALDATFIHQVYSRLVVDCNRSADAEDVIARVSDGTNVPANQHLGPASRSARFAEIYNPYHLAIERELTRRDQAGFTTILVALHSFTPVMGGDARPWNVGVLHDAGETRFAVRVLTALRADPSIIVGDNEPYRMDATDYTIPRHAYPGSRAYVELEVRQDLLHDPGSIALWANRLKVVLTEAEAEVAAA